MKNSILRRFIISLIVAVFIVLAVMIAIVVPELKLYKVLDCNPILIHIMTVTCIIGSVFSAIGIVILEDDRCRS